MSSVLRRMSVCIVAGCVGALVNTWLAWYLGRLGIPHRFSVALAPTWSLPLLYQRLVWGGMFGLLFLAPFWKSGFWTGVFSRGVLFGLVPTLFQLLYVFPVLQGKGMFGSALGALTPLFVFFYDAVWGFFAALWLYFARE